MSNTDAKLEQSELDPIDPAILAPPAAKVSKPRFNVVPVVITLAATALAIVMGEFTIAAFLARPSFGPYLSRLANFGTYEPAAVALISFGLTWLLMVLLALVARRGRSRVTVVGGR